MDEVTVASGGNQADRTYAFDWRRGEHARVTTLLAEETLTRGPMRILRAFVWVVVLLAGLISLVGLFTGEWELVIPLLPLAIAVALLTFGFARITGWLQAWHIGRTDPNTADPITYRFADSGLQISMKTVDAELRWSGVPKVRETSDLFLIHYSARRAYFLPKRAIRDDEAVKSLAAWIRSRLPEDSEYVEDF